MRDKEEVLEIVDLLAQNEQVLAGMYYAYGESFPDFKLWEFLKEKNK